MTAINLVKKVPRLRFRGFSDEWEEKKLGEVGENIIGLTYSPKNVTQNTQSPIVLRSSNIKNDALKLEDIVRVVAKINTKLFVRDNDILICTRNGSQRLIGKNILLKNLPQPTTFGAFMSVYRSPFNDFNIFLFKSSRYSKQIQMNLGARINQITTGYLNKFKFYYPSSQEQEKIAGFLGVVDDKISGLQSKKEQLEKYKKGIMQKIFPPVGGQAAQIRFKDENGEDYPDWEEKKLSTLASITTGKKDVNAGNPKGKYRFYTCAKNYTFSDEYTYEGAAIMIAGNAEVGLCQYYDGKFEAYQRTYVLQNFQTNGIYLFKYLSHFFRNYALGLKQTGAMSFIKLGMLTDFIVPAPAHEEQQNIADFLTSIDDKINLTKKELEQAKTFKKALLQGMFV